MDATTVPAVFNFNTHAVRTVVKDGQPWFVAVDVCSALGYVNTSKAIGDHLDVDEKANQSLGLAGSPVNIISESGLYALVLRSRKPEARKFAKWVTSEVLPAIRKTGKFDVKTASGPLTKEMQQIIKNMVTERAKSLPLTQQAGVIIKSWSALKSHFGMGYKEIPADQFAEALSLVARMQVEWELVEPPLIAAPVAASYHYPLSAADPHDRWMANVNLTPARLLDPKNRALELELIAQLEGEGHDVEGLKMRILALRDAVENYQMLQAQMQVWTSRMGGVLEQVSVYGSERGKNVIFAKSAVNDEQNRQLFPGQVHKRH